MLKLSNRKGAKTELSLAPKTELQFWHVDVLYIVQSAASGQFQCFVSSVLVSSSGRLADNTDMCCHAKQITRGTSKKTTSRTELMSQSVHKMVDLGKL